MRLSFCLQVVVKEAFQTEDEEVINFSQLSHVAGTLTVSDRTARHGDPGDCVLLDGSAVYGARRPDGWLDTMRRYSCPIGTAFVVVDVLGVKASRAPLVLSGGAYTGPGFDEGATAHARLHLEEYFHVHTAAVMSSSGAAMSHGASAASIGGAELPFDTVENPRASICNHVDPSIQDGGATVLLEQRCGLGKDRAEDGNGLVTGFAVGGGQFEYDGLVTTEDRYFTPHYHKLRRFRFVGSSDIGTEGDVRAFVLSSSSPSSPADLPTARMTSCANELGCTPETETALDCSCVQICTGNELRWAVVVDGHLIGMLVVGTCDSDGSQTDAALVDQARLATLGAPGSAVPPEVSFYDNVLGDPSFEATGPSRSFLVDRPASGWTASGTGFELTSNPSDVRSGGVAVRMTSGGAALQTVRFPAAPDGDPLPTEVRVRGCSKPVAVTGCGAAGNLAAGCAEYSLSADVTLADGSTMPVPTVNFDPTAAGYHCRETSAASSAGISQIVLRATVRDHSCSAETDGTRYQPIDDIGGQPRTEAASALDCAARCGAVPQCAHWSMWADGGCHLSSSAASRESETGVVSGSCVHVTGGAIFDDFDATVVEPYCWGERSFCRGIRTTWGAPTPAPTPAPSPAPSNTPTPAPTPAPTREACARYGWQPCAVDADCTLPIAGTGHLGSQRTGYGSYTCQIPDIPGCAERRCVPIPQTAFVCAQEADCTQGDVCVNGLCVACAADPAYSRGACNFTVGVSPYHFERSMCAGDHCMHECAYDTHCVRVTAESTFMDLTAVHNTLGPVVLTDETRADLIRPGSCGGTDDFGMRCSGDVVREAGNTERTPATLRSWDANIVQFESAHTGGWEHEFQVTDSDRASALESWQGKGQPIPGQDPILHVGSVVPHSVFDTEGVAITVFSAYNFRLGRMAQCQVKWTTTEPRHPSPSSVLWGATTDPVPNRSTLLVRGCVRWNYNHGAGNGELLWHDTRTEPPTAVYFAAHSDGDCTPWQLNGGIPHSIGMCTVAGPNVTAVIPTAAQRAELYTRLKDVQITSRPYAKLLRTAFHDAATYSNQAGDMKGGPAGCIRHESVQGTAANFGIPFMIDRIPEIVGCGPGKWNCDGCRYGAESCPWSAADVVQFAGAVASAEMGGPNYSASVKWGRSDDPWVLCQGELQKAMPDFNGGHKDGWHVHGAGNVDARLGTTLAATRVYFEGVLGLSPAIWVALLGAHSVGGVAGVGNAKAFVVPFDTTPGDLDSGYYQRLQLAADSGKTSLCPQMRSPGGAHWFSPTANNGGSDVGNGEWMILLDTDLSMTTEPELYNIVKQYAHNTTAFHEAFAEAMLVVSELGREGGLVEVA